MALKKIKDVSDATIVSEDKKSDDLDFDKLDKEKKEVVKEKTEKVSTTIDLKEDKTETSERVTVDFINDNNYEDILKKKSKKAEEDPEEEKSQFGDKTQDQLREEIKVAEEQSKQNFSAKDMEDIAKVIIMVIDTGISTGLRMWAKDTSDSAYSISTEKRKMLEYQLTLVLVKYQSRFSIEFMFLISLVICYVVPFTKARTRRREMKAREENAEQTGEPLSTTEIPEELKRKRGKPTK